MQVFFQEFDNRFENTSFMEHFLVAASKIHKFLISFIKLVLKIIFNRKILFEISTKLYCFEK